MPKRNYCTASQSKYTDFAQSAQKDDEHRMPCPCCGKEVKLRKQGTDRFPSTIPNHLPPRVKSISRRTGGRAPVAREAVQEVLTRFGPLVASDIADELDWTMKRVNSVLSNARMRFPEQVFRIARYAPQGPESPRLDRAVYAAEAGKDAPRPKIDKVKQTRKAAKAYRKANRARLLAQQRARYAARKGLVVQSPNPFLGLITSRTVRAAVGRKSLQDTASVD